MSISVDDHFDGPLVSAKSLLPTILEVDEDSLCLQGLSELSRLKDEALVLHGAVASGAVARLILRSSGFCEEEQAMEVHGATLSEVDRICSTTLNNISTIVAIGGGTVQDVAKLVAKRCSKSLICIPTLLATDGVASPVSVISDARGKSTSYSARAPELIILCWEILNRVPDVYWKALIGDITGNLVAVRDVRRVGEKSLSDSMPAGCQLAEAAALRIIEWGPASLDDQAYRHCLVECALQSSFAMIKAGSSHPCSGAEHLLSHAIDTFQLHLPQLHGGQVGASVLGCLDLHGAEILRRQVKAFYHHFDLPLYPGSLGASVAVRLSQIVQIAPLMRIDRHTILSEYRQHEILKALTDS